MSGFDILEEYIKWKWMARAVIDKIGIWSVR